MSFSSEQQKGDMQTPVPELNIQDLERMNDEEFWNYARQRAHAVPERSPRAEYLECKLSGNTYLVPLRDLAEVLSPPYRLARLPGMPGWMAGIMAWRGETIAIAHLDLYFFPPQAAPFSQMADGVLLVVHAAGQALGLLVPVLGLTTAIESEEIVPFAASTRVPSVEDVGVFEGLYTDIPILNISALLASMVQQIGMATLHG